MFWIATATYLSFYPLMLVLPLIFIFTNSAESRGKNIKVCIMVLLIFKFHLILFYSLFIIFFSGRNYWLCWIIYWMVKWITNIVIFSNWFLGLFRCYIWRHVRIFLDNFFIFIKYLLIQKKF
jgi:hypothetical protein